MRTMSRLQLGGLIAGLFILAIGLGLFALDYLGTRSDARLAMILTRLGPGTPLDDYIAELGEPSRRFTEVATMKSWGPSTDESLLSKTGLYYFAHSGLPYRYIVVYVDKSTQRSVSVTWKGM